jgi:hypothetical protein
MRPGSWGWFVVGAGPRPATPGYGLGSGSTMAGKGEMRLRRIARFPQLAPSGARPNSRTTGMPPVLVAVQTCEFWPTDAVTSSGSADGSSIRAERATS